MALRIELWQNGALVDGVEEWWDDVESALEGADGEYPILDSISPYGDRTIPPDRLQDLAIECSTLAQTGSERLRSLLRKLADLCGRASESQAELRFSGD
jgi:hypothetical protein